MDIISELRHSPVVTLTSRVEADDSTPLNAQDPWDVVHCHILYKTEEGDDFEEELQLFACKQSETSTYTTLNVLRRSAKKDFEKHLRAGIAFPICLLESVGCTVNVQGKRIITKDVERFKRYLGDARAHGIDYMEWGDYRQDDSRTRRWISRTSRGYPRSYSKAR